MACERPNHICNSCCLGWIASGHEVLGAAAHAHRKPTTKCLAIADDVCVDIVGALCSTRMKTETSVHLVKDEDDASLTASLTEFLQPLLVARTWANFASVC